VPTAACIPGPATGVICTSGLRSGVRFSTIKRVLPGFTMLLETESPRVEITTRTYAIFGFVPKLLLGRGGSNGKLKVAADHIVFDGGESGESRTWKFSDINNVNSSDPFELTISTLEGENRVQLKTALTEDRYQDLWLRISQYHGLRVFGAAAVHEH
jgi:hypothetical protein